MKLSIILLCFSLAVISVSADIGDIADGVGSLLDGDLSDIIGKTCEAIMDMTGFDKLLETFGADKLIEALGIEEFEKCFGDKEGKKTTAKPSANEEPQKLSLEEKVMQKKEIKATVDVYGARLNVWEEDTQEPIRYFVTPMAVLNTTTINCKPDYTSRYIFYFDVHVWDNDAVEIVKMALLEKDFPVDGLDILPLPMMEIRAGIHPDLSPLIQMDTRWRTNENQPNVINFQLHTENATVCDQLVKDAVFTPNSFLARTKLYYEFKMAIGSVNTQIIEVFTIAEDKPLPPPVVPLKCDLNRYYELAALIEAGTPDPVKYAAWIKELADLIIACKGQI